MWVIEDRGERSQKYVHLWSGPTPFVVWGDGVFKSTTNDKRTSGSLLRFRGTEQGTLRTTIFVLFLGMVKGGPSSGTRRLRLVDEGRWVTGCPFRTRPVCELGGRVGVSRTLWCPTLLGADVYDRRKGRDYGIRTFVRHLCVDIVQVYKDLRWLRRQFQDGVVKRFHTGFSRSSGSLSLGKGRSSDQVHRMTI